MFKVGDRVRIGEKSAYNGMDGYGPKLGDEGTVVKVPTGEFGITYVNLDGKPFPLDYITGWAMYDHEVEAVND